MRIAGSAPSWSEELARWFIVGITFVGGSVALKKGSHVGVTIMVKSFPGFLKRVAIIVANVLVLIFLSYAFRYGLKAAIMGAGTTGDIIQVSMLYTKLNVPLGCLFMITHVVYYLVGVLAVEDVEEFLLSKSRD